MSDKIGPLEMPAEEIPRFYADIINKLGDERDDLRSEVITLEWQLSEATKAAERLRAALKGVLAEADRKTAAFDRAREALGGDDR